VDQSIEKVNSVFGTTSLFVPSSCVRAKFPVPASWLLNVAAVLQKSVIMLATKSDEDHFALLRPLHANFGVGRGVADIVGWPIVDEALELIEALLGLSELCALPDVAVSILLGASEVAVSPTWIDGGIVVPAEPEALAPVSTYIVLEDVEKTVKVTGASVTTD
jgi:hypothetical protein